MKTFDALVDKATQAASVAYQKQAAGKKDIFIAAKIGMKTLGYLPKGDYTRIFKQVMSNLGSRGGKKSAVVQAKKAQLVLF